MPYWGGGGTPGDVIGIPARQKVMFFSIFVFYTNEYVILRHKVLSLRI